MTDDEMLSRVIDEVDDPRLDVYAQLYLDKAKACVVGRLFPWSKDASWSDVPQTHHQRTCDIAVYLLNRRGSEGETRHVENGLTAEYESGYVPKSYLDGLVPFVGVPL